jgi:hypothetical protein
MGIINYKIKKVLFIPLRNAKNRHRKLTAYYPE